MKPQANHILKELKSSTSDPTLTLATDQEIVTELNHLAWFNSEEAAKYLRKTTNALRIMVSRGHIRPRKFRRRLYFRRVELDRLLESSFS